MEMYGGSLVTMNTTVDSEERSSEPDVQVSLDNDDGDGDTDTNNNANGLDEEESDVENPGLVHEEDPFNIIQKRSPNRLLNNLPDPPYVYTKLYKIKHALSLVEDLAFLPDDRLVVGDKERGLVRIYGCTGKYSKTLLGKVRPYGITCNKSGTVVFVDGYDRKDKLIKVYASDSGDLFSMWGDDFTWKPRGVTFSNKGQLIVTDTHPLRHSVGVYTLDGRKLRDWGSKGSEADQFLNPWYVHVDMFDRVIVSDKDNHSLKLYTDKGMYLGRIGGVGSGPGELLYPRGVCSDSRGNLIVCDTGNRRVCVFARDGRYMKDLLTKSDALGYPYGVSLSRKSGLLAVSQQSSETGRCRKIRTYL